MSWEKNYEKGNDGYTSIQEDDWRDLSKQDSENETISEESQNQNIQEEQPQEKEENKQEEVLPDMVENVLEEQDLINQFKEEEEEAEEKAVLEENKSLEDEIFALQESAKPEAVEEEQSEEKEQESQENTEDEDVNTAETEAVLMQEEQIKEVVEAAAARTEAITKELEQNQGLEEKQENSNEEEENTEAEAVEKEEEKTEEPEIQQTQQNSEEEEELEAGAEGAESPQKEKFSMADATARIGKTEEKNIFNLVDENGKPVVYEEGEKNAGEILLKEGTQVVQLEASASNPELTGVVLWQDNKYREGFVESAALEGGVSADNEFATETFINDAEHILARSQQKINQAGADGEAWLIPEFENVKREVEGYLQDYRDGKLKIDNEMLNEMKGEDEQFMQLMLDEPVRATSILEDDIKNAYDPKDELGQKLSEKTLFSPLSPQWFESDDDLTEYAERKYKNRPASITKKNQNFEGSKAKQMKETLLRLKKFVKKEKLPKTDETEWLRELKNNDLKDVTTVITNRRKKVDSKTKRDLYIADSIGPLQAKSMMTDALEQMNGEATANQEELVRKYWDMANQGNFEQVKFAMEETGEIGLDALFQLNSSVALIYLKHCMQRIKAKNKA